MVSIVYMLQIRLEGPVQVSWGIGGTRREVVRRLERRVRVCTLERRMASLPGGCSLYLPYCERAEETRERRREMERGVMEVMCMMLLLVRALVDAIL